MINNRLAHTFAENYFFNGGATGCRRSLVSMRDDFRRGAGFNRADIRLIVECARVYGVDARRLACRVARSVILACEEC